MRTRSSTLYLQVLAAIALGVLFGLLDPAHAALVKPFADAFVRLVKMVVAPVVFVTLVTGVGSVGKLSRTGRVGLKALVYFEVVTTFALAIGLAVVHVVGPGRGLHVVLTAQDARDAETYATQGHALHGIDFVLNTIPSSMVDPFVRGEILQVLVVALFTGIALATMGERAKPIVRALDALSALLFTIVGLVMRIAPLGAFSAMSFTVGKYGLNALAKLGSLMLAFYVTALLFVLVVLGTIVRLVGLRLFPLLRYLSDELLVVLGTSSSESALPGLIAKMEALGCDRAVVGLVVPFGYSFNLDGTSIYLTMAVSFIAQATDTPLAFTQQLEILGVLLLTSKGAATVTGGGFVTLAATLSSTRVLPVAGLSLLLGIDRFMSEARALVNLCGNAVATLVIARWEGALDLDRAREVLAQRGRVNSTLGPS